MNKRERNGLHEAVIAGFYVVTFAIIVLLFASLLLLVGCSTSDEPNGGDRSGEPYKFRVEISAEKSDEFDIQMNMGNYNFVDENGLPRTIWLFEDNINTLPSPCIQEYMIPSNFNKVGFLCNLHSLDVTRPVEETFSEILFGKLFVNNKLLAEWSNKFSWHFSITYNEKDKKYTVSTSDGKSFETNRID